jgi:predicted MFS family arabinose efflux permease
MLWLTFAPITTGSAHHYGVSEGAIGWLSELFPLLYVVLALPAGIALDRWFRPALLAGAVLTAGGGLLRLVGDGFGWVLAGQILVGIAQPLVLNAVTKLAGHHFEGEARQNAISVGSAGIFVGMILGFVLGPALGGAAHLHRVLVIEAVLGVIGALWLAVSLRSTTPATNAADAVGVAALKTQWADGYMKAIAGLAFIGFGVFIALTTWLQALLHPHGVSDATAGGILVGSVVAGVITTAVLPVLAARRGAEVRLLRFVVIAAIVGCIALTATHLLGVDAVAVVLIGAVVLPALPVLLELGERRAGSAGASAAALIWTAGNIGGLVLAVPTGALVHHAPIAFGLLSVAVVLGLPVVRRLDRSPVTTASLQPAA